MRIIFVFVLVASTVIIAAFLVILLFWSKNKPEIAMGFNQNSSIGYSKFLTEKIHNIIPLGSNGDKMSDYLLENDFDIILNSDEISRAVFYREGFSSFSEGFKFICAEQWMVSWFKDEKGKITYIDASHENLCD